MVRKIVRRVLKTIPDYLAHEITTWSRFYGDLKFMKSPDVLIMRPNETLPVHTKEKSNRR